MLSHDSLEHQNNGTDNITLLILHLSQTFSFGISVVLTVEVRCHLILFCAGWGPFAYFRMLAETRNSAQASTNTNPLSSRPSEIETVCV